MSITIARALTSAAAATSFAGALVVPVAATVEAGSHGAESAASAESADVVTVTDDTGAFSVAIPATWSATTAPDHYPGIDQQYAYDTLLPTIVASPTGEQYDHGEAVLPSLFVQVYPDPEAVQLGEFYGDYGVDCTAFDGGAFDSPVVTGTWATTAGCSWAPAQVRASLWAQFDDGSGSVFVDYYSTTGADATWQGILDSLARTAVPIETVAPPTVFPFEVFGDVPQLGTEPVRGTGCGGDGSIGDVIPDGIWAGFADVPTDGAMLSLDLVCIYVPEAATGIAAGGEANVLIANGSTEPNLDYLVVNNNERERQVSIAPDIELRDATRDGDRCVEGPFLPDVDHTGYQAWINIEDGEATWVIWGCDWYGAEGDEGDAATAATTAPAVTSPSADSDDARLAADCARLANTIWEGDAFLGVEYPADGAPFTESLRQAIEATRDMFSYEATQVESELAEHAFAQYYAEWDSLLQAGIYTTTNIQAVTEAGWLALEPLQIACGLPTATR